jgi:Icc protein
MMLTEIVQLTDPHLFADPQQRLKGVPTRAALEDVLQFINDGMAAGRWKFEWLVLSGDLAHDEQRETYVALRDLLGDWSSRCSLLPGNHDDRDLLREVFPDAGEAGSDYLGFSLDAGPWRLMGLDSLLPGEVIGRVDSRQLDWLRAELRAHEGPALVFLHHPPFSVRSEWIDALGLRNAEEVLQALADSGKVRAVSCGHVHQAFATHALGMQLFATPSTAIQFQPRRDVLVPDPIPPGFRIFRLWDKHWETEVVRLPELTYPPEP